MIRFQAARSTCPRTRGRAHNAVTRSADVRRLLKVLGMRRGDGTL